MKPKTFVLYINGVLSDCLDDEFEDFCEVLMVGKELLKEDKDISIIEVRERVINPEVIFTFKRNWAE